MNDGICPALCSLEYVLVDQAAKLVKCAGPGVLMAKLDLSSAYRHIPVQPNDSHLLGFEWQGIIYMDRALPYGLRSAPKIFIAVADGLAWAMVCKGIEHFLHYLDGFFFCSLATSSACREALRTAVPRGRSRIQEGYVHVAVRVSLRSVLGSVSFPCIHPRTFSIITEMILD